MEIVVGTYEELTLAYKIVPTEEGYEFQLTFTDHSHTGCIRAVAVSRRGILATGSSDEIIRLFNLKKHFEIGSLMHHNGRITNLSFHAKTHMFSTSSDGSIGVWQVGKWECLRTLRGHKAAVNCVSVHPTGRMALSVGQDKNLRIWNLMTGKCAYVTVLKQAADIVLWSPGGSTYVVVTNNKADVYDVETAKVKHTIQMTGRIQTIKFIKPDTLVLGGEEGKVEIHDVEKKTALLKFSTDTNRVKGLDWCPCPDEKDAILLVTASSDGFIKIWKIQNDADSWTHTALGQIQTKFRPTCAALFAPRPGNQQQKQERKIESREAEDVEPEQEANEEEDNEDEEEEEDRLHRKKSKRTVTKEKGPLKKKKRRISPSREPDSDKTKNVGTKKRKVKPSQTKLVEERSHVAKSVKTKKSQSKSSKALRNKSMKFKQRKRQKVL